METCQSFNFLTLVFIVKLCRFRTGQQCIGVFNTFIQIGPIVINLTCISCQRSTGSNLSNKILWRVCRVSTSVDTYIRKEIFGKDTRVGRTRCGIKIKVTDVTVQHIRSGLQAVVIRKRDLRRIE